MSKFAFRTEEEVIRFADAVRGQSRFTKGNLELEAPPGAVLTATVILQNVRMVPAKKVEVNGRQMWNYELQDDPAVEYPYAVEVLAERIG